MGCWEPVQGAGPSLSMHQEVGGCLSCALPHGPAGAGEGPDPVHLGEGFTAGGPQPSPHIGPKLPQGSLESQMLG